jgi:tRNA U34 5-methylaminomethyl-2-thiouridine-forming methyltransferase MnmC
MRLSSDAPEDAVLAPKWWMNKSQFLNFFRSLWSAEGDGAKYLPLRTGDGSYTLYHPEYRQYFHSVSGAKTESEKKYLEPLKIRERLRSGRTVRILEIGFGLGFNAGEICRTAEAEAKGRASVTSLESDLQVLQAARTLPDHHAPEMIRDLAEKGVFAAPFARVSVLTGDARKTLPGLSDVFDFIFLDGFSPDSNPELWTLDLILRMKEKLRPGGAVVCYSSAYPVAGAFLRAGFDLRITEPFGRKRFGLAAFLPPADTVLAPFPEKERAITLRSTAGTPYRDPELNASRAEIRRMREEEVRRLRASGVPKWFRSAGT